MSPDQTATGRNLADAAWDQTLAALNRDGGVSIYDRAACPCCSGVPVGTEVDPWDLCDVCLDAALAARSLEPHGCSRPLAPIEDDALDARDEARRRAEDQERERRDQ